MPSASSTRRTCAFCGHLFGPRGTPHERTGEHALASWLLSVMPGNGPVTHSRQSKARGPMDQVWTKNELDIVAKQVCRACNGGWMNDLENAARPFLTPLIQGRGRHLHETGQALLAAWAAKTALALHLTTPENGAPLEHYREIANTHLAPAQTLVWLAAHDAKQFAAFSRITPPTAQHAESRRTRLRHNRCRWSPHHASDRLQRYRRDNNHHERACYGIRHASDQAVYRQHRVAPRAVLDEAGLTALARSCLTA
jgi:hypothetical protein